MLLPTGGRVESPGLLLGALERVQPLLRQRPLQNEAPAADPCSACIVHHRLKCHHTEIGIGREQKRVWMGGWHLLEQRCLLAEPCHQILRSLIDVVDVVEDSWTELHPAAMLSVDLHVLAPPSNELGGLLRTGKEDQMPMEAAWIVRDHDDPQTQLDSQCVDEAEAPLQHRWHPWRGARSSAISARRRSSSRGHRRSSGGRSRVATAIRSATTVASAAGTTALDGVVMQHARNGVGLHETVPIGGFHAPQVGEEGELLIRRINERNSDVGRLSCACRSSRCHRDASSSGLCGVCGPQMRLGGCSRLWTSSLAKICADLPRICLVRLLWANLGRLTRADRCIGGCRICLEKVEGS